MTTTKKLLPPNSGADARHWRRRLAATAERNADTIRTLKFPLEIDNAASYWDEASKLHHTIAGDAPGSLIHFLYTLHLAGFRVFGKEPEMAAFRSAVVLNDAEWRQSVLEHAPLTDAAAAFVPSLIYQRLLFAPRAVGGKDTGFRAEIISVEYAKFFCKGKHGDKIPTPEKDLFDAIGAAFAKVFTSWKEVVAAPDKSAAVIDDTLAQLGYRKPERSLSSRIASIRPCEPAGPVAFDPSSSSFSDVKGIEPHLIVSKALRAGLHEGIASKKELTKFSQEYLTGDANHGGLAWTFGKGLVSYFQSVDVSTAMLDFDIPKDRQSDVEAVLRAAKQIPDASGSLLGGKNYSAYRTGIGSVLGSWFANYITRLFDLETALSADVEPLVLPPALLEDVRLFAEIGISPDEIADLSARAIDDRPGAAAALSRLVGKGAAPATRSDIEEIERYNTLLDTLAGLLGSVAEKVRKATEIAVANHDDQAKTTLDAYTFKVPSWIKSLEKINRLDLAPVDPASTLAAAANEFDLLHNAMHEHYATIREWAKTSGETLDPLARIEAQEAGYARNNGKKRNATEYAARACFDMIGRAARRCSEETLRRVAEFFRQQEIFADEADCNRFFFNRQGRLFKAVFDNNPRQPFAVTRSAVTGATTILAAYAQFLADFRKEVTGADRLSLVLVTDMYRLERGHFAMLLSGMPAEVPSHLALPDAIADAFNLPLPIQVRLRGDMVSSAIMRRIFNNYYVRLESLAALLLRDRFFLRAKFQRAGDNALLYSAASSGLWAAPERLYATERPIGSVMRHLRESSVGLAEGKIDPALALAFLVNRHDADSSSAMRAYLRQAPHDWYFPWPGVPSVQGVMVDKAGLGKKLQSMPAARIVGSPAFKGMLDTMLASPNLVKIGDVAMLFEQRFTQNVRRDASGNLIVTIEKADATVYAAMPVTEARAENAVPSFTRYVAIDLGEMGLGYAVFDAGTDALIDQGRVSVKSMRRLVQDDRAGRKKRSEINKFRAAFDPAEERRRENIVGDFCNAINRLMWYYDAFPVLEYAAGGASTAVDKVYAAVADYYLYANISTVDKSRESYWAGASYWKHPVRTQYKFDKATGKKSKTVIEPLSLFPGVGASAYGTSQECSCCRRNPIDTIRQAQAAQGKGDVSFVIGEGGVVSLDNGRIRLHYSAPEEERAGYRARNERTPLSKPADPCGIKGVDLIKLVRRNLRQAPASKMVKDTSISRYHCVYDDCGKVIHAEENAAINIGVKFSAASPKLSIKEKPQ